MNSRRPPRKLDENALWDYALKALGVRSHSSGELREKLRRKAETQAGVDAVLGRLKDRGLLNDKAYAEYYASRRLENEGFGRARVLADLRGKRVAPAVAQRAVEQTFEGTDEVALIEQFLARKYRKQPLAEVLADDKGLASAWRKLRLAGFSSAASFRVLKRYSRNESALFEE